MSIVSIKNGKHYVWGNHCDGWHLASSSALSVIQERVPSGSSESRHFHNHAEQFFYVLAGTATLEVEGDIYIMEAGEGVHVPAGYRHTLSNSHQHDLHFLVISTPPSHGDRVNV